MERSFSEILMDCPVNFFKGHLFDIVMFTIVALTNRKEGLFDPNSPGNLAYDALRATTNRQWYIVPLIVLAFFIYSMEIRKKNYRRVFLGLSFFFHEFFNEMLNAAAFYYSGRNTTLWICSCETAYMITVGYTIEIAFFFLIVPLLIFNFVDGFEKDHKLTFFEGGFEIRVRVLVGVLLALTAVAVEMILVSMGLLVWEVWWWSMKLPFLLWVGYSKGFVGVVENYEKEDLKGAIADCLFTIPLTIAAFIGLASNGVL